MINEEGKGRWGDDKINFFFGLDRNDEKILISLRVYAKVND